MHPKRFCCCPGEPLEAARYLEVTPVISIPTSSYMYENVKFFLDLGEDLELNEDLVLYEGGSASTANAPVELGYVDVFVPSRSLSVIYADGIAGSGNLDDINALRHRGWKIKEFGLRYSNFDWETGDFSDMTRVTMDRPESYSDDAVDQVDNGGFYFLTGEFSQTPALVQQRSSVDQDGNPVNYFMGYNPRRECSRPEQARTYNNNNERLLFDFTSEFPPTKTFTFTYKYRKGSSNPLRTVQITKTYEKFVGGSATRPTFELLDKSDFGTYKNVNGFVEEDPIDSDYILFGYRAIDCTEERSDPDSSGDYIYISAPCMPVKYYSFGTREFFVSSAVGVIKVATGDPGEGLSSLLTDENNTPGTEITYLMPHTSNFGVVMSDVTEAPDLPFLADDVTVVADTSFGQVIHIGFAFGGTAGQSTNPAIGGNPATAMSYKGATELNSIHTLSPESAYFGRTQPLTHRGYPPGTNPTNITIRNLVNNGWALGTGDVEIIGLDSKSGSVSIKSMTNPIGNGYHYLTDGLSEDSDFPLPGALGGGLPPPSIS